MTAHEFTVHQEADVVPSRRLIRIVVGSILVGGIGVAAAAVLLVIGVGSVSPSFAGAGGPKAAPAKIGGLEQTPITTTHAAADATELGRRHLDEWGWVDRDAGTARIPVERAMSVVVEQSR